MTLKNKSAKKKKKWARTRELYSLCVPGQTCDKQHVQRHLACMRTVNSGECVQWGQYQDFLVPSKSDASFGRVGRQPLLAISWQNRQPLCGKLMLSSLHQWNATSTPSSSCFHLYSKARTCLSFLSSRKVCTNPQWQKCFKRIIATFISQISAFTSVKCSCVSCPQMFLFFNKINFVLISSTNLERIKISF